jgi:phosphoglycolate phosphatase
MARRFKAIIFDLDGTLFRIPIDWHAVRASVERVSGNRLTQQGLFPQIREIIRTRPGLRAPIFKAVDREEAMAVASSRPFPGAVELLESISPASRLALVTLQGKAFCDALLREFKLDGRFEGVFTREASLERAEQLAGALKALGVPSADALFVGDKVVDDVSAARTVAVRMALVGGKPAQPAPDHSFPDLFALRAFLTG